MDCYDKETLSCNIMLNIACLLSGKSSAHDCYPTDKPSVSAVLFGCHGINLLKNLVSRELLRILENFHFSISISKHFDFTFHFSKKSESFETHSVIARCMGKTCGIAAVLAATAATAAGPRGRNPISESTVKQSEK